MISRLLRSVQLLRAVGVCKLVSMIAAGALSLGGPVCSRALAGDVLAASDSSPLLITLGTYGVYAPRFEGSKRHDLSP